jgi:hypothetical protein
MSRDDLLNGLSQQLPDVIERLSHQYDFIASTTRTMTSIIKISALALLSLVLGGHAQAIEPNVIMLSCDGKLTNIKVRNAKPQPINKMGLVVDFAERTISFQSHLVGIDKADVARISFSGENNAVHGEIDRVTGVMWATTDSNVTTFVYNLLCKPTTGTPGR